MPPVCRYVVDYGDYRARFSNLSHAIDFAQRVARAHSATAEVHSSALGGMLVQFDAETGEISSEFREPSYPEVA